MSLFNQSSKAVSAAVQEIADSVGLSADAEMTQRSFRSLCAGIQYLNGRANWDFALVEASPIAILAPFSVTGVSAVAGQSSALAPTGHGFKPDDVISGNGIQLATRISTTAASSFTMNSSFLDSLGTGTQVLTAGITRDSYDLPADWKAPYSARLMASMRALRPLRRRFYDRSIANEYQTSTPVAYDVFQIGAKGRLRMLPPPAAADVLQLRYYRRVTVPSTSATADPLDVPQDYESYLIAWAKWHFIMDKGEGRSEQGQTWLTFAENGIRTMLSDQTRIPDEDLSFIPGVFTYDPARGPNSTRGIDWVY